MRHLLLTLGLLALILPGCRSQAGQQTTGPQSAPTASPSGSPGSAEPEAIARTEFTSKLLNFFEYKPLTPGSTSDFLIHLTDLRDGHPVAKADVTLQLRGPNGQPLELIKAKVGRVTGIYVAKLKAPEEGTYDIDFHVKNDKLDETMALKGFKVSSTSPVTATPASSSGPPTVAFLMEQQWLIDMKLAKAEKKVFAKPISSTGRIVAAANSHAIIASPVAGTITGESLPRIGERVSQGTPVAVVAETATAIENAQLRAAEAQVESARIQTEAQLRGQNAQLRTQNAEARIENARLEAEKRALVGEIALAKARRVRTEGEAERARQVFAIQGISEKELRAVELAADEARTAHQALVARQKALAEASPLPQAPLLPETAGRSSTLTANGAFTVSAPFSGVVTKIGKALGEQVAAGEAILEIANLRTVWLECPVFERDLGALSPGMEATFSVLAYPKRQFRGSLLDVGSVIDEKTRATNVLFKVDNDSGDLKLGMQADVRLASRQTLEATVIPREAVLDREGKKVVYVLVTGEEFVRRDVTVGEDLGALVGITSGLNPGERVVTQGAYQVFLQETNPAEPGVHSHET